MKGSVKKDKKTGMYFYITDIGIDPLTGKRKRRGFTAKKKLKML
ncbi:integrase [Bacillus cereus]|nr:integrase [Bacillus cereus]